MHCICTLVGSLLRRAPLIYDAILAVHSDAFNLLLPYQAIAICLAMRNRHGYLPAQMHQHGRLHPEHEHQLQQPSCLVPAPNNSRTQKHLPICLRQPEHQAVNLGGCHAVRRMELTEGGAPLARLSDGMVWLLHPGLQAWLLVAGNESPAAAFASLHVPPVLGTGVPAAQHSDVSVLMRWSQSCMQQEQLERH